jgi:acetolactate synthase-1/2/3 large subunit
MGYGIPAAIAAKLCFPERPVCAVVGDGGFLMTAGELAVAVRQNLPLVVVLLADSELALIRIKQQKRGNPVYGTPVGEAPVDGTHAGGVATAAVAAAGVARAASFAAASCSLFGVPIAHAADARELENTLRRAFASDGPSIVEVRIDASVYDALVLRGDRTGAL